MTDEELKAAKAPFEAAYREDSIAGLEAHYEKIRALVPKLTAEVERLREARNPLRVLSASEIQDALHQGRAEAMASQGDNAWSSLLRQRDEARNEVERLRAENATAHARLLAAYKRIDYLESLAGEGDE